MYRKILLPVQKPAEVEPLIRFASMLLDADGEIRVLHVIPTITLPEVTREWRESVHLVVPAHEAGASLDVKVEPEVRAATDVPAEILESAEAHGVDAIVLTLRGDKRSRNPFVGHTATGILQHAPAHVLVLNRLALAADRYPRILLPTLGENPSPTATRLAEEIAVHVPGAPVVALSIGAGPRTRSVEGAGPDGEGPRGTPITRKRSIFPPALLGRRHRLPDLILEAAQRERYGLLLVGEEADQSGGPLLTRRFLEGLFRAAPCPVLAVRG
ncbi:MAG TPA: universal stress protein [Thermoplasmata archaeon]|nr:universal stress protein [Thermoplasmata archaeon]